MLELLPVHEAVVVAVGLGADEAVGGVVEAAARVHALGHRVEVVVVAATSWDKKET